ncbi:hypothetical protein [Halosimplex pelagicum]|uniref:Uncharacterized protein n=1 Tax=Halosimplex pelagicum TaxID=869886 RepID=A0A7D5TCT8_9EURY|nr:hypothetical protein [Halosimplex pelagicum]QLH83229.1 hypothetical protein HZS54_17030 [Halosimplex pelagicum]
MRGNLDAEAIEDLEETLKDELGQVREENQTVAQRQRWITAGILVVSTIQALMLAGIL